MTERLVNWRTLKLSHIQYINFTLTEISVWVRMSNISIELKYFGVKKVIITFCSCAYFSSFRICYLLLLDSYVQCPMWNLNTNVISSDRFANSFEFFLPVGLRHCVQRTGSHCHAIRFVNKYQIFVNCLIEIRNHVADPELDETEFNLYYEDRGLPPGRLITEG